MQQKITQFLQKIFRPDQIFKYGFNISPMYRRSVGRIKNVSRDLMKVEVKLPINYKNRNYVGAIFGGSLFASTDPVYMIQLMHLLGDDYVVWDKSATIHYKRPAREKMSANFEFTKVEINEIKTRIDVENEIDIIKKVDIKNKNGKVFSSVEKTIYIASKAYYKKKLSARRRK